MKNVNGSYIVGLLLLFLQACAGNETKEGQKTQDTLLHSSSVSGDDSVSKAIAKDSSNITHVGIDENILGVWKLADGENASFEIKKGKIYYPDYGKSYKYKVASDTLKVKYDDYEGVFAIKLKGKDTLTLIGDEEQTYYRMK
jgi:hypothetical protein